MKRIKYKGFSIQIRRCDYPYTERYYSACIFYPGELMAFDTIQETLRRDTLASAKFRIDQKIGR